MNVYRLKNGKTTGSFQLPIRSEMIPKFVDGETRLKRIIYVEGSDSIFLEDHKGDQKGKSIWFEDGEIRAHEDNYALNEILRKHSWNGKHYELVNEEETAKKGIKLEELSSRIINAIITERNKYKLQAMAMILISEDAAKWGEFKCKEALLKQAKDEKQLKRIVAEMDKADYETRLIAALAFNKEIIKYNLHHTAVIWNDGREDSIIVKLAQGETGINKLSDFLGKRNEASEAVLHRIGEKTDDILKAVKEAQKSEKTEAEIRAELIPQLEKEIRAKIYAETRQFGSQKLDVKNETTTDFDKEAFDKPKEVTIEDLREQYKAITGKGISPKFANDRDWLSQRIKEASEEAKV